MTSFHTGPQAKKLKGESGNNNGLKAKGKKAPTANEDDDEDDDDDEESVSC